MDHSDGLDSDETNIRLNPSFKNYPAEMILMHLLVWKSQMQNSYSSEERYGNQKIIDDLNIIYDIPLILFDYCRMYINKYKDNIRKWLRCNMKQLLRE
jgi:hypothetical protein